MLTAPTPRYTGRIDAGFNAAQPSTFPCGPRATRPGYPARPSDHCAQVGSSGSKLALAPAIPAAKMRAAAGQSSGESAVTVTRSSAISSVPILLAATALPVSGGGAGGVPTY